MAIEVVDNKNMTTLTKAESKLANFDASVSGDNTGVVNIYTGASNEHALLGVKAGVRGFHAKWGLIKDLNAGENPLFTHFNVMGFDSEIPIHKKRPFFSKRTDSTNIELGASFVSSYYDKDNPINQGTGISKKDFVVLEAGLNYRFGKKEYKCNPNHKLYVGLNHELTKKDHFKTGNFNTTSIEAGFMTNFNKAFKKTRQQSGTLDSTPFNASLSLSYKHPVKTNIANNSKPSVQLSLILSPGIIFRDEERSGCCR